MEHFTEWTGWPDGDWEHTFSDQELEQYPGLTPNHWACVTSGFPGGDKNATQWIHGTKSERRCQGAIICEKHPYCGYILRPKVKNADKDRQLLAKCLCGAKLRRTQPPCRARQRLYHFSGGIHFIHLGTHNHPRLTHVLHLSKGEKARFEKIVTEHPTAGPLELLIGPNTLRGPGPSVADISPALLNKDRIKSERRAVKDQAAGFSGGDSFISHFRAFCERHPGFVLSSHVHEVTVISMQTPTMISQLVKDSSLVLGPASVNGIVSDAAHGFWRERASLLIVSSSYSLDLHAWIPALLSYSNGATHEHFRLHFLTLFQSIAREKQGRGLEFTDEDLSNVVDFSEAERNGFIEAFVDFFGEYGQDSQDSGTISEASLRARASELIRGCRQHFRAGVTRIKRIGGVIPVGREFEFEKMAHNLLDLPDAQSFRDQATRLLNNFHQEKPS